MKKIILLWGLLSVVQLLDAQLMTYITLEGGPQWSLIRVADPGGYFKGANVNSSMAGLTIGQEILPGLSLVSGLYYQLYKEGINLEDDRPGQVRWEAYNALLVPLRAEYRVQIPNYPVSLTPRLGYIFGILRQTGDPYPTSGIISAPDGAALSYQVSHLNSNENLHMLEVGIGLNLRFHELWQASLNLSYMTGFTEPLSFSVDYTGSTGIDETASYSSKGNTLFTSLAFNLPVSNIWQRRDLRIRKRIENSVFDGDPVGRKGQFYLGAETGSLWRLFHITNPAIAARPLEKRGIFRYADFHAGGYAGYMVTEELGLDIGINYQRSGTFFALMYDHEADFVYRSPAPLFLEVPFRIRYFYDTYKSKLHYVVYGGVSLLAQFSSGIHTQGQGGFTYISPGTGTPEQGVVTYAAERTGMVRPVLRAGTGVEYRLPTRFPLIGTLYLNYMHGFVTNDEISITTSLSEAPSVSMVNYNGSGWSVDLGIKFPFRLVEPGSCGRLPERAED